jgi:hypothetical protein
MTTIEETRSCTLSVARPQQEPIAIVARVLGSQS